MAMVKVEHEYIAKEPDELTIHKGDVIKDVVRKAGGWWEGVLNDKRGVFPDNFVKVIENDATTHKRRCKVIFNYVQDHEDELTLNLGDIVDILGEEEEGWWRGVLNGKEGVFPSNFVEEIFPETAKCLVNSQEDLSSLSGESDTNCPVLPPKPAKILCKVNYFYQAQNEDELTLNIGDILTLISKDGQDAGWWRGELNGSVGVFPDNFVTIITNANDTKDKKSKQEPLSAKASVASQRKSLELKKDKEKDVDNLKSNPPIPGKKPVVPLKKSPSNSSSSGGLFSGLKKKIVDVVDGASNSKNVNSMSKGNAKIEKSDENENAFDQVERNSLLSDPRATRAKAPGRRPPSTIFKDGDAGVVNGNSEHLDALNSSTGSVEQEIVELKPKVREWEKHKVPWLEEMKFNQARRTATSPGPEQSKLKLTPDKLEEDINNTSPFEPISPIDMSKSMPSLSTKLKTPPNELEKTSPPAMSRTKPSQLTHAVRPLSNNSQTSDTKAPTQLKPSANVPHSKPISPVIKSTVPENIAESRELQENVCCKQYAELLDRIAKLEMVIEKLNLAHKVVIDDLKGKLQVETDMRMLLQAEVDKLSQCVMQV